jgi:predicted lipid-binding transport protein (Tim44 family)
MGRNRSRDGVENKVTTEMREYFSGDWLNPVKLRKFWAFTRYTGNRLWQLAGINQPGEPSPNQEDFPGTG